MIRWIVFLLVFTSIPTFAFSQKNTLEVISSNGGSSIGSDIQLDWTLGELAIAGSLTANGNYTEGFHQPAIKIERVENPVSDKRLSFNVQVTPNPVSSSIFIQFERLNSDHVELTLTDLNGRVIIHRKMNIPAGQTQLDISDIPPGLYLLRFTSPDGAVSSIFKLFKI